MRQMLNNWYVFFIYVVLVLATVIAFEPIRRNGFVDYDDDRYVTSNPEVSSGLNYKSIVWAFTTPHGNTSYWHPLAWLSHMLDCELFGLNPLRHHLTSLLLHIINTLLLFWVFKRMTGAVWPSAFVAAAFALHPLHVESVAWVAERKDVLSGLFWMLTMIAYGWYAQHGGIRRFLLVFLGICLALMAKPMAVTLPFVLLLLDYWPLERVKSETSSERETCPQSQRAKAAYRGPSVWHLIAEKIPLLIPAAIVSVITYTAQQQIGTMMTVERLSIKFRISNALVSYVSYIVKMVYPSRLAVLYPLPVDNLPAWQPIVCLIILVGISAGVVYAGRQKRYLLVGWLWYLGTLVPVIGLIQVGAQAMADRYIYMPAIGIFIMVGWGAAELLAGWRYRRMVLSITAGVVLAVLLTCTRMQAGYWKDNFTLFGHALEVTKNNSVMHNNFGNALRGKGRLEEAVKNFDEALRIKPKYIDARYNKASTLLDMGRADEAIALFKEVLGVTDKPYEVYNDLGLAYAQKGEIDLAIQNYNEALRLKPDYVKAMNNLGSALKEQGKIGEAIQQWKHALEVEPNYPRAHFNLALAMVEQGRYDDADKHFNEALRIRPGWAEVYYYWGLACAWQSKYEQAVVNYNAALRIDPNFAEAHSELGVALARKGNLADAIRHYTEALRLKPDRLEPMNNLAWVLATAEDTKVRNPAEAVRLAERACELTKYEQPELLDTLAAGYAAAGRFSEAIETAEKAIKLAESAGQKKLAGEIQSRLQLYKAGQPYIKHTLKVSSD